MLQDSVCGRGPAAPCPALLSRWRLGRASAAKLAAGLKPADIHSGPDHVTDDPQPACPDEHATRGHGRECPGRPGAGWLAGPGAGVAPHPPRLQGGAVVSPCSRRLVLRSNPGRGGRDAAQLRGRGGPAHRRLRGGGRGRAHGERGQGAGRRGAGDIGRGRGVGRRPRHLPDRRQAAQLRIPAGARPPPQSDQHLRRDRPRAGLPVPGGPPLLPRARIRVDPHADHHGQRLRGRRRDVPRLDPGLGQPADGGAG